MTGTRADWIADQALRGLIGSAMRLPFAARVPMMGSALSGAIGPLVGYRRRAEQNLARIYPDMPTHRRRRIARAVCDNFGRTLIENFSWEEFSARLTGTPLTGAGLEPLAKARAAGRAVIFVTGHYANYEVPRHLLVQAGYPVGGLYRPMQNPFFNDRYAKTMTSWGGPVFAQGRAGTIGFARHLAAGGMGTLLFDVHYKAGISLPFLGHPAMTATSAADLALKFDALVLPYFATRGRDGLTFDVEIEAPIAHNDPPAMMAEMTQRLESRVTAHPDQWFWVHRRWKPAPTATASA